ncbi:MAG: TIGR04211 family SH3 domain-containing protein [Gammaproteobacteria bacterium]|jgi:SH3 domain protein
MNSRQARVRQAGARLLQCLALAMALVGSQASAETLWVTDMLQLELYGSADMSGRPIKKLKSGDRLAVIEKGPRYAQVRTDDGQQGWVKSLYLVDKEPARTRLNKLEEENTRLDATVTKLENQLKAERGRLQQLQEQNLGSADQKAATIAELERLRVENEDMMSRLAEYSSSVPVSWLILVVLFAAGGGFIGGWYWVDSRSRAKHGGYRVY